MPAVPFRARAMLLRGWGLRAVTDLAVGLRQPAAALERARADLVLWAPVALGTGIGGYFQWPGEPSALTLGLIVLAGLIALLGWIAAPEAVRFIAALTALCAAGFVIAVIRSHAVAAPVLSWRYYGMVEGRVVDVDRSGRDQMRLTLDQLVLEKISPRRTPLRVRVSLHDGGAVPQPGARVQLTAHLQPPSPPAEPGAWDFRRAAWFMRLGAIGYSSRPVEVLEQAPGISADLAGQEVRLYLSRAMQAHMQGQAGAVASALMTGDRSGISGRTNDIMRASGLYHIISISGLHMGMLAGFVFGTIRYGLALVGSLALRLPTKKIAAAVALAAATAYLWIAGAEAATLRSYIMAAVMLCAVLVDRRALSLHTVALAALVILVTRPEGLTDPGFQMSFAATVALILALGPWNRLAQRLPWLLRPVLGLAMTSLVASLATGPVAAAHFSRMSAYGLLANMLAVPVMGALVMPAGVIAAVIGPLGLAGPVLWLMQMGTEWMILVAGWVAGMGGAVELIAVPPAVVLPLMSLGAAIAVLSRGPPRLAGGLAVVAAFWIWAGAARPVLLVAPEGDLVGLMTPQGRALSKASGGFVAARWLEADGDEAATPQAAGRPAFAGPRGQREADWDGWRIVHLSGRDAIARAPAACHDGALLIVADLLPPGMALNDCEVWDQRRLRRSGALAFDATGRMMRADDPAHRRLWMPPERKPWRGGSGLSAPMAGAPEGEP